MKDEDGLFNVFIRLRGKLARTLLSMVPPREIEDIVQETYVRACQITNKGRVTEPQAFLFKIARNLALDYIKKANTRLSVSVGNIDTSSDFDAPCLVDTTLAEVVSREEFSEFCEAIRELPPQRRRAFVLKKVYGYTQREIATEMQISEKTVERHISLGMNNCMEYFDKHNASQKLGGNQVRATVSRERGPASRGKRR